MNDDYDIIMKSIMGGDLESLNEYSEMFDDFPNGKDHFVNRNWITNAINCGNIGVVEWMLQKGVSVIFRDDEGHTVLHWAIDRENEDRYDMMRTLLKHGADVNMKGDNDWTPSHMAAVRNDLEALKILKLFDADLSIRTEVDDYATPYEEALQCGAAKEIVTWLKENTHQEKSHGN